MLDAARGAVKARIKVDLRPRDVAFTPDGKRAYATAEVGGTVSVIDVATERVIATIRLPKDAKPMGVPVSPDDKRVYVATGRGGTVEVIDAATNKVIKSIKVGQRPWGIALTPDGKKLYTANGPSNDVSVVDTDSLKVLKTIPVGKDPLGCGHRTLAPAADLFVQRILSWPRHSCRRLLRVAGRITAGAQRVHLRAVGPLPSCTDCGRRVPGKGGARGLPGRLDRW